MAIIKYGANGLVSGKAGSLVYVLTKRGNYVRGLPRTNKKLKPTPAQLASRSRFAMVRKLVCELKAFIDRGFNQYDPPRRATDCATSYNLREAVLKTEDGYAIDWENFAISRGVPDPITSYQLESDHDNGLLRFTWDYSDAVKKQYDLRYYECHLLLYPAEQHEVFMPLVNESKSKLHTGEQYLSLPVKKSGVSYYAYVFFFSADTSNKSTDSRYLGLVEW